MDKNDIDKLFNEGLKIGPSNQFDEKHWKELEKRLDNKRGNSRLGIISLLSSVAAACLIIIFMLNKNKMINNSNAIVKVKEKVLVSPDDHQNDVANIDTVKAAVIGEDYSIRYIPTPIRLPKSTEDRITDSFDNSSIVERVYNDNDEIVSRDVPKDIDRIGKDTSDMVENVLTEHNSHTIEQSKELKSEHTEIIPSKSKGSFAIIAALDLTEVKGAGQQKLSENIGLLYTQPITNRLSMSTGALYSRKKYESPYSYYKPENPYKGSHAPTDVSAVCDVLSVPILVNYKIFQAKSYTITASTGVSSYFMLKEKYDFAYAGEGYKPYNTSYTLKGKNQHYFGVADFSVSFDRKINNKLSIGIRPFMQIPLTGIGYGRTNLQSKGVAVSFGIAP